MGPIWGRQDPGGTHVGPINFALWVIILLTDAANFRFNFNMECPLLTNRSYPWWRHQMETFSVLLVLCDRWIPLTKTSDAERLMYSLICAWPNSWANNWDACDLIRHHAHYDVTVMRPWFGQYPVEMHQNVGWRFLKLISLFPKTRIYLILQKVPLSFE